MSTHGCRTGVAVSVLATGGWGAKRAGASAGRGAIGHGFLCQKSGGAFCFGDGESLGPFLGITLSDRVQS